MKADMEILEQVVQVCRHAQHVGVLSGAGISAESGVATFRGENGIWNKINPLELASMQAFMRNPERILEWYNHRREIILSVQPNAAHFTLAAMENHYPRFAVSTQNIDGLHQRAGSRCVQELHGSILRNRCTDCGEMAEVDPVAEVTTPPRCHCGGLIRPDIVWFGEMLPEAALTESVQVARQADVYFSIGTSAVVYPAAQLPYEALERGAYVIEINLEPTELSNVVHASLRGKAGEILPRLCQKVLMDS